MARYFMITLTMLAISSSLCSAEPNVADSTVRKEAEEWLNRFAAEQVLFHPDDVKKLIKKVAGMSDEEVGTWWNETKSYRDLLDSPDWIETRDWLKQFLNVQAIYSEDEIRYFQSDAFTKAQDSPRSLKEIMDELTNRRKQLIEAAKRSEETRKQVLASRNAYVQDVVRQREAAALRRSPPPATPAPRAPIRQRPVSYNRPLVTSLDAARWSVIRSIYPRW